MEKEPAVESPKQPTIYPIEYALGILDYLREYGALCAQARLFSFPYEITTVLGEGQSVLDTSPEDDINELIQEIGGIPAGITDPESGRTQIIKLMKWRGVDPEDPTRDLWDACDPAEPEEQGEVSVGLLDIRNDLENWSLSQAGNPSFAYVGAGPSQPILGYGGKPAATILP